MAPHQEEETEMEILDFSLIKTLCRVMWIRMAAEDSGVFYKGSSLCFVRVSEDTTIDREMAF